MKKLTREEIECLWNDFNKENISENLLHSYYIIFKMAARYATALNIIDDLIKKLKSN